LHNLPESQFVAGIQHPSLPQETLKTINQFRHFLSLRLSFAWRQKFEVEFLWRHQNQVIAKKFRSKKEKKEWLQQRLSYSLKYHRKSTLKSFP